MFLKITENQHRKYEVLLTNRFLNKQNISFFKKVNYGINHIFVGCCMKLNVSATEIHCGDGLNYSDSCVLVNIYRKLFQSLKEH